MNGSRQRAQTVASGPRGGARLRWLNLGRVGAGLVLIAACSAAAQAYTLRCQNGLDAPDIAKLLKDVRRSVDPCGESGEIIALLDKVKRCTTATYRICTDDHMDRNSFYKPPLTSDNPGAATEPRTIQWNPTLRTELEEGCDGDPTKPVLRDPVASLVHELAHAAQDCDGLDPSEHEFEAVRIENIYRRAKGLCQRSRYGADFLPGKMVKSCDRTACRCQSGNSPLQRAAAPVAPPPPASTTCDSADCAR